MRKFGILLGAVMLIFTGFLMVGLTPQAHASVETTDTVGYCFVIGYGGSRRKYCI